jgi:ribosomal protein L40E
MGKKKEKLDYFLEAIEKNEPMQEELRGQDAQLVKTAIKYLKGIGANRKDAKKNVEELEAILKSGVSLKDDFKEKLYARMNMCTNCGHSGNGPNATECRGCGDKPLIRLRDVVMNSLGGHQPNMTSTDGAWTDSGEDNPMKSNLVSVDHASSDFLKKVRERRKNIEKSMQEGEEEQEELTEAKGQLSQEVIKAIQLAQSKGWKLSLTNGEDVVNGTAGFPRLH